MQKYNYQIVPLYLKGRLFQKLEIKLYEFLGFGL